MSKETARFYKTAVWVKCQKTIMKRDGYLCQDCLKHGKITPATEVHHIKFITPENMIDPAITTNPDNLVSLCHDCHEKRHAGKKRWRVDKNGRIISIKDAPLS